MEDYETEKKIFFSGVQESIFCEDFDDFGDVKIWTVDESQFETPEMLETRRIMQDEKFAQQLQAEYARQEQIPIEQPTDEGWQPVSSKL